MAELLNADYELEPLPLPVKNISINEIFYH